MNPLTKYQNLGSVSIDSLTRFIFDQSITEENVILLHPDSYDDVVLEHRSYFDRPVVDPFKLQGVLILEDKLNRVPLKGVGVSAIEDFM